MRGRRTGWLLVSGVVLALLGGLLPLGAARGAPLEPLGPPAPTVRPPETAPLSTTVLYDGALGGTPDAQGFFYLTFPFNPQATQVYSNGATILDTMPVRSEQAGYFGRPTWVPTLERSEGYTVTFTLQLLAEAHDGSDRNGDGVDDRAGFSVIVLSDDLLGIELGFWSGEVWAQEGGDAEPPAGTLFTHAEGAAFDATAALTAYALHVEGESYTLHAAGAPILTGPLRDYTAFSGFPDPYQTPNFVFLGDDTGSAQARARLSYVAATTTEPPPSTATPTPTATRTPSATATGSVPPSATHTVTGTATGTPTVTATSSASPTRTATGTPGPVTATPTVGAALFLPVAIR